jgi:superoxide dismutase
MNQRTLFDCDPVSTGQYGQPIEPKLSRNSDPLTSHKAAIKTHEKLVGLHKIFFETLAKCESPATAQEVAAEAWFDAGSVSDFKTGVDTEAGKRVGRSWIDS